MLTRSSAYEAHDHLTDLFVANVAGTHCHIRLSSSGYLLSFSLEASGRPVLPQLW
jgi:hypothetical protein